MNFQKDFCKLAELLEEENLREKDVQRSWQFLEETILKAQMQTI